MLDLLAPVSANFRLGEFAGASKRALTESDLPRIQWWADTILQPFRDIIGPVRITSYIRPEDVGKAHENGGGIDIVPSNVSITEGFDLFRAHLHGRYGRVINERNHIHIARPGPERWAGYNVALNEPTEGEYVLAGPIPFTNGALFTLAVFFGILATLKKR